MGSIEPTRNVQSVPVSSLSLSWSLRSWLLRKSPPSCLIYVPTTRLQEECVVHYIRHIVNGLRPTSARQSRAADRGGCAHVLPLYPLLTPYKHQGADGAAQRRPTPTHGPHHSQPRRRRTIETEGEPGRVLIQSGPHHPHPSQGTGRQSRGRADKDARCAPSGREARGHARDGSSRAHPWCQ